MKLSKLLIMATLIMLVACAGKNFNEGNISQLQTNVTTIQQAEQLLGPSYDSYTNNEGTFVNWMYAKGGGITPHVKTLQLRFNDNVLNCVRVLSGFNTELAEQAGLVPCEGTIKN